MKKLITCILGLWFAYSASAQNPVQDMKYRRSSMFTLMIGDTAYPHAQTIRDAFLNYPVPDKFNDHNLKTRIISGKAVAKDQKVTVNNYVNNNNIAKDLVAKWFNRNEQGAFNMDLLASRGSYNASEMDVKNAKMSKRGSALLADAGEELIGNTFVLISDFKYLPDSLIMAKAKDINSSVTKFTGKFGGAIGQIGNITKSAIDMAETQKGYVVVATSYLYKLDWNDSVAAVFYQDYWMDSTAIDTKRKAAFDSSSIFKLIPIGDDKAWAMIQTLKLAKKSEDELIKKATVNAIDAVIAKLQRNHQEFRTKTPLASVDPCTAKIGLKEGLEKGDNYEVLVQSQTPEGRTTYEKVGNLTVDGKQIWDNRYMAELDTVTTVNCTLFKGGNKKMAPGMLIKQK